MEAELKKSTTEIPTAQLPPTSYCQNDMKKAPNNIFIVNLKIISLMG